MTFRAHVLQVLIASPGDTAPERDAIENALARWNGRRAGKEGVVLLPHRWEKDAVALMGGTGQGQINEQLVDAADIVLAVFDARLGSPTAVAISGTAEEIFRAHDAGKPTHVWFSREGLPRDVDIEQFRQVQKFERELRSKGLHVSYDSPEDLANKVRDAVELDIERLEALGSLPRLSTLPSHDDFARLHAALLEADARAANADEKVVEIADALLTFTESMSPVLRGLAELWSASSDRRAACVQRVLSSVLGARMVLFPGLDARIVVYKVVTTSNGTSRLEVDDWAGRPRDHPHAFISGDGGRGDKAFAWLRNGGGLPRFTPDTRLEPDPDWQGSGNGYRTYVSLPLVLGAEVYGMMTVDAPRPGDLDETDLPAIEILAQCMALGYAMA